MNIMNFNRRINAKTICHNYLSIHIQPSLCDRNQTRYLFMNEHNKYIMVNHLIDMICQRHPRNYNRDFNCTWREGWDADSSPFGSLNCSLIINLWQTAGDYFNNTILISSSRAA